LIAPKHGTHIDIILEQLKLAAVAKPVARVSYVWSWLPLNPSASRQDRQAAAASTHR
jgi:hypothetical protein